MSSFVILISILAIVISIVSILINIHHMHCIKCKFEREKLLQRLTGEELMGEDNGEE